MNVLDSEGWKTFGHIASKRARYLSVLGIQAESINPEYLTSELQAAHVPGYTEHRVIRWVRWPKAREETPLSWGILVGNGLVKGTGNQWCFLVEKKINFTSVLASLQSPMSSGKSTPPGKIILLSHGTVLCALPFSLFFPVSMFLLV